MLRVLQAGRGLAAAGVAAFHLSVTMGVDRYGGVPVFAEFTRQGFRGVDFFFVLSGFIIFFAHFKDLGKPEAWSGYVYRRFVRVYPIYWLYTAGIVVLLLLGFGTEAKNPQGFGDWLTSWTLIRFTDAGPPIPPAWTLFHEVAFYALFSLLVLNIRVGAIVLAIWACACAVFWQFPMAENRTPFNVYTAGYNLFFLFGMGAFWLYRRGGRGFVEFAAGVIVTIAAAVTLDLPYKLSYLALVLGFALLVAGATKMELGGYIKVPNFLNYIGNASYSIYLTHLAIQGLLLKISMASGLYRTVGAHATYLIVLAGTIALGCLVYGLVEKPLISALQKRHKSRRVAPAPGAQHA
jgi:peptidoglycan/LPS O-acetylase OafA/YrhL